MPATLTTSPTVELLSREAWQAAWHALPADRREVYWHPVFCAAAARWEGGVAECVRAAAGDGAWLLYPYVRHPVRGYDGFADRWDAQTAYGYGGPLLVGDWEPAVAVDALREIGRSLARRGAVAEFVRCHTEWVDTDALPAAGYRTPRVRTNVEYDLPPVGPVDEPWASNVRRNLRKAAAAGLRWSVSTHLAAFESLYRATAHRLEMADAYRFDPAYFAALHRLDPSRVKLILVTTADGTPAAAALLFIGGRLAHYHLGASDFAHQASRPNDLLYLAMATVARDAGCARIVWGGGTSDDPADTLLRFKSGFGAIRRPVHVGCRALDPDAYERLIDAWTARHPDRAASSRLFLRYRT